MAIHTFSALQTRFATRTYYERTIGTAATTTYLVTVVYHTTGLVVTLPTGIEFVGSTSTFTNGTLTGGLSVYAGTLSDTATIIFAQDAGPLLVQDLYFGVDSGEFAIPSIDYATLNSHTAGTTITLPVVSKGTADDVLVALAGITNVGLTSASSTISFTGEMTVDLAPRQAYGGYLGPASGATDTTGTVTFATPDPTAASVGMGAVALLITEVSSNIDLEDGVEISDPLSIGTPDEEFATDTFGMGDASDSRMIFIRSLADLTSLSTASTPTWGWPRLLADGIAVGAALEVIDAPAIRDQIRTSWALGSVAVLSQSASDNVRAVDATRLGSLATVSDEVGVAEATATVLALRVVEALRLGSVLFGNAVFLRGQLEGVSLADTLRQFFAGEVSEQAGFATALTGVARVGATASDSVGLVETTGNTLVLRLDAEDTVSVDPLMALQMLYSPSVVDGVEMSAAYVSPDGSITTWAVNTRTGSVTEYQNFEFNSFAPMGVKYLGASSAGLYELNGDDDAGTDIISRLKTGFLSFAGSRFSGFRAAYIGVRGPGDYVFRLITSDDKSYTYSVDVRRMETTKVLMGKGIRSTYFAFELISTGQDFDLDFVELVPARANRRV